MTNDYDLADKYLTKAKETGAIDAVTIAASRDDKRDPRRGFDEERGAFGNAHASRTSTSISDLWAKESAIRAAEGQGERFAAREADDQQRARSSSSCSRTKRRRRSPIF